MLVCFLFTEPLARLLGASDNTIGYASSYLFWVVVIGGIPSTVGLTMSHLLRSAGYSKESGIGLALGGVSNIILDPLFMFVILPEGQEVTGAKCAVLTSKHHDGVALWDTKWSDLNVVKQTPEDIVSVLSGCTADPDR